MNYIDAHVHVWPEGTESYPLAAGYKKEDMKPASFTPEELFTHCRPSGVDRVVLIQMSYYGFDNSYMLDAMKRHEGVFSGIAVIDVNGPSPGEEMLRLADQGVRGFRIYPRGSSPESWLQEAGYERMFACGAKHNLAICPLIDPPGLADLNRMCERFPDTPVIIDHLCRIGCSGVIEQKEVDALCAMARFPRTMVKVSAFYALGEKKPPHHDLIPLIRSARDAFGADRLMWASDCPFQVVSETYEDSVALVRDGLDFLTAAEKEQILRKTAEDFFFRSSS